MDLTDEQLVRIAERLPLGWDVANLRFLNVEGQAQPATEAELSDDLLRMAEEQVACPMPWEQPEQGMPAIPSNLPMITNGKPTIMTIKAWLVHEGLNANRQSFIASELKAAAASIASPDFLVMDFNHSAVKPWVDAPKAIGLWHSAEVKNDKLARAGAGAKGILATGMLWSWAFPEISDHLTAEQARTGSMKFSMACIPKSVEIKTDDVGAYEVLHEPVFLTMSALSTTPADKDAVGRGDFGVSGASAEVAETALVLATASSLTEGDMDELKQELARLAAEIVQLKGFEARVTVLEGELATAQALLVDKATECDALKATVEAQVASDVAVQAKLQVAEAALAVVTAKEAEAALVAQYAERLALLPEAYRAALSKRPEADQKLFEARWTVASQEAFDAFLLDIAIVNTASYLAMSQAEGGSSLLTEQVQVASVRSLLRRRS